MAGATDFAYDRSQPARALLSISAVSPAYCILAGLQMLSGWADPFAQAPADQLARGSVSGRGRGGVLIMDIRYWPWVLMGISGYFGYYTVRALRIQAKQT